MSTFPIKVTLFIGLISVFASPSHGQQMMIYKEGVSDNQLMKDKNECAAWATQQTGYNPAYASSSVATGPDGSRLRGAARGAAVGAVVGEIANDDAGRGAAAGAAGGAMIGGMRKRQAQRQQQEMQNQTQANYTRAATTCLQGRGYTVN